MKNILLIIVSFLLLSCQENNEVSPILVDEVFVSINSNNDITFVETNMKKLAERIKSATNLPLEYDLENSTEIFDQNNRKFLRLHHDDYYVTTVEIKEIIKKNQNQNMNLFSFLFGNNDEVSYYKALGTTCTTNQQSCSRCCGCVPDGDYCTDCTNGERQCVRSTSGGYDPG